MLPRRLRLSRALFDHPGHEKRAQSQHFSLSLREIHRTGGSAAIVSKKVARLSVDRHRLKRRMLAVLRPWSEEVARRGVALTLYARAGSAALPYSTLAAELETLLARALTLR